MKNSFEKSNQKETGHTVTRREFVSSSLAVLGSASFIALPASARENGSAIHTPLTVGEIIALVIKDIPNAPFKETVDTLKAGTSDQAVSGIVTTMFATIQVIKKAIDLKANFIIAHEPTFYNHLDEVSWLAQDSVYMSKRNLLQEHSIALWRCHDYLHSLRPDGVRMGVLTAVGWETHYDPENPRMITLPPTPLSKIISHLKDKLGIEHVRVVGDLSHVCRRIALLPGASGGRNQIQLLQKEQPDVLICGEVAEWETSEYVRDEQSLGKKMSLVVLGHAVSEEPGLRWLADWLRPQVGVPIAHIPSGNPFTWV